MQTEKLIEEVVVIVEDDKGLIKEVDIVEEVVVAVEPEHHHHELYIFVNRIKKTSKEGVKREMKGAEIADLAKIAPANAVVKREREGQPAEGIGIDQTITICSGEHFLVTRDKVNGGHD